MLTSTGKHWFPKPGWLHELVKQSDFGKLWFHDDTYREKLNSTQEFVKIKSWLPLIFSIYLHNQLKFHNSIELFIIKLKVHSCRFKNLPAWSCSCENNTPKISHSKSYKLSSYLPVKFVFFVKIRLIFNVFHCLCMFVNKHFTYLGCAYLKKKKVL